MSLEVCQDMLTSFSLVKKIMLLTRKKTTEIWENDPSFSFYALKFTHLYTRNFCIILLLLTLCNIFSTLNELNNPMRKASLSPFVDEKRVHSIYLATNSTMHSTRDEIWTWSYFKVTKKISVLSTSPLCSMCLRCFLFSSYLVSTHQPFFCTICSAFQSTLAHICYLLLSYLFYKDV